MFIYLEMKRHLCYIPQIMREIVEDCLNKAENRGLTSISFPAIGTGKLGFPKDLAASVMIGEVLAFKKQSMRLKKVAIVLHPKDRETIQDVGISVCVVCSVFPSHGSGEVFHCSRKQKGSRWSRVVTSEWMKVRVCGNLSCNMHSMIGAVDGVPFPLIRYAFLKSNAL